MNFKSAIQRAFQRYFDFNQRAGRAEFWYFVAFMLIAGSIISIIEGQLFPQSEAPAAGLSMSVGFDSSNGPVSAIFSILVLIPWLSVTVRRLHDTSKTGWWVLFGFVPLIGWITMLVFLIKEGDNGDNKYGPSPYPEAQTQA